jgi:hypothetical protein
MGHDRFGTPAENNGRQLAAFAVAGCQNQAPRTVTGREAIDIGSCERFWESPRRLSSLPEDRDGYECSRKYHPSS